MVERVLVAGATGYLGGFMIAALKRRRLWVRALVRPGKGVEALLGSRPEIAIGGPDIMTWNEIAALAFETLGRHAQITRIPSGLVRATLPMVRIFKRRAFDIASFVHVVSTHDLLGDPTGDHTLRDYDACLKDTPAMGP